MLKNRKIIRSIKLLRYITSSVYFDIRAYKLGQLFPLKPITLNLLVNDICNSKCQMCLIWKQKKEFEISPQELAVILEDPLFSKLKSVGVSGGEPTLRSDLPEIYQVIANKKSPIDSAGIITNAINPDQVLERIIASAAICRRSNIKFSVMVSLDGIGEVHDQVRGREGNFETAMKVIRYLRDRTDIPVIFGCTITKDNLWNVDDLLDFAVKENLYGRFRIAEYINRLYNQSQNQFIRNFSELESYHLSLFFTRLEREFESNPLFKRTYRNIRSMLVGGSKRTIRCPYQTNSVVLDSRGQLLYCSPKSPSLGSTLQISSQELYLENIPIRKDIIEHDCINCIHDYHAQPTISELIDQGRVILNRQFLSIKAGNLKKWGLSKFISTNEIDESRIKHALILGWYGTETAGDKAILAEIVNKLQNQGISRITLASLNPYLTKWTIKELELPFIEIIDTYKDDLLNYASRADITVMGGGPLMEISHLGVILNAFIQAKRSGNYTYIAGCGIGPLKKPEFKRAVVDLLKVSDKIELRDSSSVNWAMHHTGRKDIINSGDPARDYVLRWKNLHEQNKTTARYLNCYLREWTSEYIGELSKAQFQKMKNAFEDQLGEWITNICLSYNLRPRLLAMHHFSIGGDDRVYNRNLARTQLAHLNPIVEMKPFTLNQILSSMQEAVYVLTMRFHSTLFAHTLEVPFTAIDYTQGGKIKNFLIDNQSMDHYIDLTQVAEKQWQMHPLPGIST